MLSKGIFTLAVASVIMVLSGNIMAQRGMGRGMMSENGDGPRMAQCNIPDLTPDQEAKIKDLRTSHLKEVTPLRNEMNEKKARLQTLQSAENVDLNAINKTIDEISQIKATLMKKGAAHRAEVSSLLTDDQKVFFNSRGAGSKGGKHGKHGNGCMGQAGNGKGFGQGNW